MIISGKHSQATPLAYKIFIRLVQELFQTESDPASFRTTLNLILNGYASERRELRPAVAYMLYQPQFPVVIYYVLISTLIRHWEIDSLPGNEEREVMGPWLGNKGDKFSVFFF